MTTKESDVDEKALGEIGTRRLFENDDVVVWEMRLSPGERTSLHRHAHDYVMIQISGDRIAADFEPDTGGSFASMAGQRVEGEVEYGSVFFADEGGKETAVNIGAKDFHEIIVEIKRPRLTT
jgi:hypothetical protein